MLTKRLFCFGFESPAEARANARDGTDYESSTGVWIESSSDEEASAWGQVIAERLVQSIFEQAKETAYSWADAKFANWIEREPDALRRADYLPMVKVGEMPDLTVLAADA